MMLKLLLCILASAAVAVLVLELRQQRLELSYQTNRLHTQIEQSQAKPSRARLIEETMAIRAGDSSHADPGPAQVRCICNFIDKAS